MNVKSKMLAFVSGAFVPPSQAGSPRSWNLTKFLADGGYRLKVYIYENNYMSLKQVELNHLRSHRLNVISVKTVKDHRKSIFHRIAHYALFNIRTFLTVILDKEIDILYVGTPPLFTHWFGYIVKVLRGKTIILEIKDMHPEESKALGFLKNSLIYRTWLKIENFFRDKMDLIVALTPTMYMRLKEYGFENIVLISNIFYQEDISDIDERKYNYILKHFNDNYIVLYTGGMGYAQNLETILEAAYIIKESGYSKINFVLIGSGEKSERLKSMIKDYNLKNVLIFDAIPRKAVKYIQTKANTLIASYFNTEISEYYLPNRIFDYHGAGKPIILAGKGDAANLIKNAGSGIVVPPEKPEELVKAVNYLYENQNEAKKMGKKGKSYILENFNERKTFGLLLKSIESLL